MISLKVVTLLAALTSTALSVDIVVKSKGGVKAATDIPYGLMHEDINYAGDGGIYAEMIRNRAFQGSDLYPTSLAGWSAINGAQLAISNSSDPLSSALPSSMNVKVDRKKRETVGFANLGWWGFDVRRQEYTGSFYVKGEYDGTFTAYFQSNLTKEKFGETKIKSKTKKNKWVQHEFTLRPRKDAPSSNNTFAITFDSAGVKGASLDFNLISVFPPTYKGRKNGLRPDIANAFAALEPKFLRFPGGNALEGPNLANPWKWNETIGPLKNRPGRPGVWGYQTSDGLGLVEYLEWAEDMNMQPILGVWAGLALDGAFVPQSELQPWIDDALREIEFVRGPVSSPMGKLRASLGHPKPWPLKYVEIGNEDWLAGRPAGFESYIQYRYPMFKAAIKAKYPDIQIIASPSVFDNFTVPVGDAGDYHPYEQPDHFFRDFHKFDKLTTDNLTLIGEYASTHPNGGTDWAGLLMPFPWWQGAIGEAIFLISAERNADKILGATQAPLMRNMNSWQWSICMVEFEADTSKTVLSTSWHLFKLFSTNIITHTLPTTPSNGNTTSLFWGAGGNGEQKIVKLANYNTTDHKDTPVSIKFDGERDGRATLTLLTGKEGPLGYNTVGKNVVNTEKRVIQARNGKFEFRMPELSVAVLELGEQRGGHYGHGYGKRDGGDAGAAGNDSGNDDNDEASDSGDGGDGGDYSGGDGGDGGDEVEIEVEVEVEVEVNATGSSGVTVSVDGSDVEDN